MAKKPISREETYSTVTDAILDNYIDNMSLYEVLGDEKYLQRAKESKLLFNKYIEQSKKLLEEAK